MGKIKTEIHCKFLKFKNIPVNSLRVGYWTLSNLDENNEHILNESKLMDEFKLNKRQLYTALKWLVTNNFISFFDVKGVKTIREA